MTDHAQSTLAYQWMLHPDSARALTDYRRQLAEPGLAKAGAYLCDALSGQALGSRNDAALLEGLVNTKQPLLFPGMFGEQLEQA